MTIIPALLKSVKQRSVSEDLFKIVLRDRSIPWRLRAQVINTWRKQCQISE